MAIPKFPIPETAEFDATVRYFTPEAAERLQTVLPRVCEGVAMAHGVDVEIDLVTLFPPTVNDEDEARWALQLARDRLGVDAVQVMADPVAASEDFSLVLTEVPGAMLFLGATPPGVDPASAAYNHSPEADFDEAVLVTGAHLYASLAENRLAFTG